MSRQPPKGPPPGVPQTDPPKPAGRAVLQSVRFREPLAIVGGGSTIETVTPLEKAGWEVACAGPSVIVLAPPGAVGGLYKSGSRDILSDPYREAVVANQMGQGHPDDIRIAVEVPRQMCQLRWMVPAGASVDEVVQSIFGQGGFSAVHIAPNGAIRELRRKAAIERELRAAEKSVSAKAEELRPQRNPLEDDEDDEVGFGEKGES